jgi:DNA polymerase-3 subunit epsilon
LDGLCKRFNIDTNHRTYHGALKDALLLAKVYYFLSIQENNLFSFDNNMSNQFDQVEVKLDRKPIIYITEEELKAHQVLCEKIKCNVF